MSIDIPQWMSDCVHAAQTWTEAHTVFSDNLPTITRHTVKRFSKSDDPRYAPVPGDAVDELVNWQLAQGKAELL